MIKFDFLKNQSAPEKSVCRKRLRMFSAKFVKHLEIFQRKPYQMLLPLLRFLLQVPLCFAFLALVARQG
jgi:hypothetical protein